jgi:hypothetical protein
MIWQAFDDDTDCDVLGERLGLEQINVELRRPD